MKSFNLKEAKAGKPVVTRNGDNVEILTYTRRGGQPIVALVDTGALYQQVCLYHVDGTAIPHTESISDLFMKTEKKTGWINIYSTLQTDYVRIYPTKELAITDKCNSDYITTIPIEWEE